ncbi:hypothetical protein PILCRDRAFT_442053 [Piloderma croceum F 1598]|uniref:Cytochrome b561 domain-containing protein n=1 Tax=Piloderma croceum (strain F 1598) TaxID=765440 RepID=A0A0C3FYR9_PILCF|nr:hypothetical protein PILCRDRAFT_442053 [Piloderma croceum F 1598]
MPHRSKTHWILSPPQPQPTALCGIVRFPSSFHLQPKMCSAYLFTLLSIVALAFISPTQASVDSHRANGESAGETKLYSNYIYVHAIFMAITFLFLVPLAIFASRFGRNRVGRKWFAAHAALNGIAICLFFVIGEPNLKERTVDSAVKSNVLLVAFGVGWVAASPGNLKHSHHKLGVVIFALVFFQFFLGIGIAVFHRLQSKKPRERRTFTDLLHMWFGRVVLLLAWCQLWDGVLFFGSPLVVYILLALAQGFILITYIVLEFKIRDKSPLTSSGSQDRLEKSSSDSS